MFIYNVTIKVDAAIADAWLQWLKEEHIPEVMATGCFDEYKIVRLLEIDDSEGPIYAIQYYVLSKAIYNQYIMKYADTLRQKSKARWGQRFIAFRSLMQIID